ncbi:hypothetical protein [Leptospira santarosai]|uniref:Uncharacterized protein n=1 Tax=Leptospira santarosai serovar Shermani str. LT 821 TaxID=758847 RepID=K8YFX0_9LEPT|nr:hypothetical protein [Leptospira santarosai]EKT88265.1 hypothetical protein LSS_02694 [Leptospira santarosai serovar Shermani str. LT 821]EMO86406.1 hypothetical protein LEP1GSC070_1902 [Leptospira santarosai str. AIM]EPG82730.1 hypothetical protein LEP1GSC048_3852 [Leptospira santarosai serovar Shermani str. 1342KT]MDI7226591.1 hypothetical protein [Leptospira santarosai]UZN08427.1 hypothetical protein M5D10_05570 [Leptospira santarosai]
MKKRLVILILVILAIVSNIACGSGYYSARVYSSVPKPKLSELKTKKWAILPTLNVYPTAAVGREIDSRLDNLKTRNPSYVQSTPSDIKKSLSDASFTKSISKIYTAVWEKEKSERVSLLVGSELITSIAVRSMGSVDPQHAASLGGQSLNPNDDYFVADLKDLESDFKALKLKEDYAILPVLLDYRPTVNTTDIWFLFPVYIGKAVVENYTMSYFVVDLKTGKNIRTIRTVQGTGGVEESSSQIDTMIARVLEN